MESEKRKDALGTQNESGAPDESGENEGGVLEGRVRGPSAPMS
jgi:hypothetical protein